MTLTRDQIRELASIHDANICALTFYYQPTTPRNKAHKEDGILIKDLVRDAQRSVEGRTNGCRESARSDLDRILRMTNDFRSNGTHAKAVFACSQLGFWREYDLPPQLPGTQLFVDRRFHLRPLARMLGAFPRLGIALVDRHRARLFDLRLGELTEREDLFHPLPRRGRSDGFAGYDAGHAERRYEDEARQHFKNVAEALKEWQELGLFDKWILGCLDVHQSILEPMLHPYVSRALLARFTADVAHITKDEIRTEAEKSSRNGKSAAAGTWSLKPWTKPAPTLAGSPDCVAFCVRSRWAKCKRC